MIISTVYIQKISTTVNPGRYVGGGGKEKMDPIEMKMVNPNVRLPFTEDTTKGKFSNLPK